MSTRNPHVTKLGRLHSAIADDFLSQLEPQPVLNKDGEVVYFKGKPLMARTPANVLKEAREFLKDNGIDEEAAEGSAISSVAKQLRHFDDEPLELEGPLDVKEEEHV